MDITQWQFEVVGESLQASPLPWRKLPDVLRVDRALDMGGRLHGVRPMVDDQVLFLAHAATNDGSTYTIQIPDHVAKAMPRRLMTGTMCPAR